jgi:hypothetical protein
MKQILPLRADPFSNALFCLLLSTASLLPPIATAAAPNLTMDDAALIAHIKKNDYVFTTALGLCSEEKLSRKSSGREMTFELTALCAARAAKESDCPAYRVRAGGTVDSPSWVTVRSLTLTLQCSG